MNCSEIPNSSFLIKANKMGDYKGIDERDINCVCGADDCINGLSVEENEDGFGVLNVYFGEKMEFFHGVRQTRKSVYLTNETRRELINQLKSLKIKK